MTLMNARAWQQIANVVNGAMLLGQVLALVRGTATADAVKRAVLRLVLLQAVSQALLWLIRRGRYREVDTRFGGRLCCWGDVSAEYPVEGLLDGGGYVSTDPRTGMPCTVRTVAIDAFVSGQRAEAEAEAAAPAKHSGPFYPVAPPNAVPGLLDELRDDYNVAFVYVGVPLTWFVATRPPVSAPQMAAACEQLLRLLSPSSRNNRFAFPIESVYVTSAQPFALSFSANAAEAGAAEAEAAAAEAAAAAAGGGGEPPPLPCASTSVARCLFFLCTGGCRDVARRDVLEAAAPKPIADLIGDLLTTPPLCAPAELKAKYLSAFLQPPPLPPPPPP
eukprot:Rhum_TRINITY_DN14163_c0_g1::Rhum_TRINITY_DN14163_c0_g1_i1::g.69333::m.69333